MTDSEQRDMEVMQAQFADPTREWRRWIAEIVGTFFLVLVAAGGPMMNVAIPGSVGRATAVIAPGVMVMAIILAMGKVSGAHLNPGVTLAFSLRGDFPWIRVPGYLAAQLLGASIAGVVLQLLLGVSASHGGTYPTESHGALAAFWMELILTFGLVTVILGTASGAQNVGVIGSVAVGGYIALAGMWGSPISGASMNTARTFGPDLVAFNFESFWVYIVGPILGATLAVALAYIFRGPGGGADASEAAQGLPEQA